MTVSADLVSGGVAVSIIIPTYNRWPLVADAVESALHQDTPGVEVVVVDDGSTDETASRLHDRYPTLRIIEQENAERGAARNRGALSAGGRYLCFLDADDVVEPWHVSQLIEVVSRRDDAGEDPPRVVSAPITYWDPGTERRWARRPSRFLRNLPLRDAALMGTVLPLPGLFVEAQAFDVVGGFPSDRRMATNEDWVFLARLVSRFRVAFAERPSVRVRDHPGRSMANVGQAVASRGAAAELVLEQGLGDGALDRRQQQLVIAGAEYFCAAMSYQGGEMRTTRRHLRAAAQSIGWQYAALLCGRLWMQSWLGERGASVARRARRAVADRAGRS